ncbi:DNA-dependent metalloprotease SPRTN [Gastrophryne carolinensis]
MDDDLLLAIRLQEEYDREGAQGTWRSPQKNREAPASASSTREMSVVDPAWELLDPSPDIRALFLQFNDMFFWGKLSGVEVKWSPRMTLCAGVCSYEGRGGLCSIRLSKPLLVLRPRKDLVETLLHEMIHALLFVTHNNRDRESHGPEFLKHMDRINSRTGANISVYHSFHDEVEEYRKHWWRCNGPCQNRKPYFGYVKRAMNRAPSSNDPWWSVHQRTCGGTFLKIKEPETSKNTDATHAKEGNKEVEIIAFPGKGYILGGSSQSLGNKVQKALPSSSESSSLKSPVNHILNYTKRLDDNMASKASVSKGAKISVANTKMFMSVGGSPVKLNFHNKKQNAGLPVYKNNFNITQKRTSSEMFPTSQSTASTSQEPKYSETFQPPKRPRMEVKTNIKDFFNSASVYSVNVPNNVHERDSEIASSSQSLVCCPVCQLKIAEAKINEHLDTCLR